MQSRGQLNIEQFERLILVSLTNVDVDTDACDGADVSPTARPSD